MTLLVVIPVLYREWVQYRDSLLLSVSNIYSEFGDNVVFYFVFQDKAVSELDVCDSRVLEKYPCEIIFSDVLNVSAARNMGIRRAKSLTAKFIIFHDCSVIYPKRSLQFFKHNLDSLDESCIAQLKVAFHDYRFIGELNGESVDEMVEPSPFTLSKVNPIRDCYLWSYLFIVDKIKSIFDESIGPGERTTYKSGEDVLFLFDYFVKGGIHSSKVALSAIVIHPPRPSDYSKHLLYARGQGRLFRLLLRSYPKDVNVWKYFVLFWGNALVRVFLLRKNSCNILFRRMLGFFVG